MSVDEKENTAVPEEQNADAGTADEINNPDNTGQAAQPDAAGPGQPQEEKAPESAQDPVPAGEGSTAGASAGPQDQAGEPDKTLGGIKKQLSKGEDIDVIYYVGCTASYDNNVKEVGINTINILNALGVKFGILGTEEKCCGSITLRIGDYDQFNRLATHNIEQFNSLGVKTLITSCSGCFKTIKHDYKKVGTLNFEVLHTAEFLARLIKENKIELKHEVPVRITYHDPCHMGRHSNVYDTPREVLRAIPGLEFVEMERSRKYSRCCGAGGGLKAGYPDVQNLMAQERVRDAEETKSEWFVTTCPFCYQGLQIGINAIQSKLKMKDITEVVAMAMGIRPFEK